MKSRSSQLLLALATLLAAVASGAHSSAQSTLTCANVRCAAYTKCEIDAKTQGPVCRCPSRCPVNIRYAPICASDGQTYSGVCEIEVAACKAKRDIHYVRDGECDKPPTRRPTREIPSPPADGGQTVNPCFYTKCRAGATCSVVGGQARCQCNQVCAANYEPVCGTDNKTYSNACELERAACLDETSVHVAGQGECSKPNVNPCAYTDCVYGATCRVVEGKAKCECSTVCPLNYSPVCGTDGKTYGNQCALASASCRAQGSIGLASGGECRPIVRPATDPPRCSAGCPKILLPVCGSDGKTYANSCLLKLAACQQHKSITIVRQGKCEDPNADPCNIIRCGYGATCQNGKCQCDNACPAVYEPVCGTDGETYGNSCELRSAACESQSNLQVDYEGECEQDSCI